MKYNPMPHFEQPRPADWPEAVLCRKCPAWIEFRYVETFRGEGKRPWCLTHDRVHFECCPGAEEIRREVRDKERRLEQIQRQAIQREYDKVHPTLEKWT